MDWGMEGGEGSGGWRRLFRTIKRGDCWCVYVEGASRRWKGRAFVSHDDDGEGVCGISKPNPKKAAAPRHACAPFAFIQSAKTKTRHLNKPKETIDIDMCVTPGTLDFLFVRFQIFTSVTHISTE